MCVPCTCQLVKGVTFVSGLVNQVGLVCSFVTSVLYFTISVKQHFAPHSLKIVWIPK